MTRPSDESVRENLPRWEKRWHDQEEECRKRNETFGYDAFDHLAWISKHEDAEVKDFRQSATNKFSTEFMTDLARLRWMRGEQDDPNRVQGEIEFLPLTNPIRKYCEASAAAWIDRWIANGRPDYGPKMVRKLLAHEMTLENIPRTRFEGEPEGLAWASHRGTTTERDEQDLSDCPF